ncbi:putative rhomboid-like transmembrane protein [Spiroplasma corruscae]|uniref:Putative rhomboid-like transmembrane protein n=1 Tax=Spiroplasma corruscae TaxID=216934 RepID=A0A222ENF3_9MOLU|nr:hypothetical protein [Spiroplasma corruscae]ASP28025.1 putative rhomboid-like transmembrane protein [Spiroplasma corruscae]
MKVDLNKLKLNLINYLVKVEKYKAIKEYSNEYVTYLHNDKKEFKILRVTIGYPVTSDGSLDKIKSSLRSGKREKINILNIAFSDEVEEIILEGITITVNSLDSIKEKLNTHFSRIVKIKDESTVNQDDNEENIENLSNEELYDMLSNPSKSDNVKLKTAVARMKITTINSSILFIFFFLLPLASLLATFFYLSKLNVLPGAIDLFFGATNRNLTNVGNQWWRIFTYGFTANIYDGSIMSLLLILLVSGTAVKLSKYTEGLVGQWKFSVAVFVSYPLSGFFVSVLIPVSDAIFSGPFVILSSVVGVLCVTTWNKKADPITLFSKNRLFFPLIMLILFPFVLGKYNDYIIIIMGMGIAASITLLFQYNWKNKDWYLIFPLFILIAPTLVALIAIFIPVPSPALDTKYTLTALNMYLYYNIFDHNQVNSIIEANGWYCRFASDGSIWWF